MNGSDPQLPERRPRPLGTRLLGIGARGAERVASATGIDDAVERTTEEAIVRALESPAVERAIIRVLESEEAQAALERALSSPRVERAAVQVLDSELIESVWDHLLASDQAQKLVERIAESPEVRAAITSQGVGLLADLGRSVREIADRVDIWIARLVNRMRGRPPSARPVVHHVGLVTRGVAAVIDGTLLNLSLLAISAVFGVTIGGVLGDDQSASGLEIAVGSAVWIMAGSFYLGTFWSLVGQTIGMRFLSIRVENGGQDGIGAKRAIKRLIGTAACVLTLGVGFLIALFDDRRRTLADRFARTEVVELEEELQVAPWSRAPAG